MDGVPKAELLKPEDPSRRRVDTLMPKGAPSISLMFPIYNDEHTVRRVTEKSLEVLSSLTDDYEVVIVDDASPDRAGEIADELARDLAGLVRVVHHEKNLGYGAAVRTGLANSRNEWICLTDGDDEYDVYELYKLFRLREYYDLIITFRYVKLYSGRRQFISMVYNELLRLLFRTRYRDVSTGFRLVRRSLVGDLDLQSNSPFIGAELAIKTMLKGYRVGEVGIQTFPREFGRGASVSTRNILATIRDLRKTYRTIFSENYDLPPNRVRGRER